MTNDDLQARLDEVEAARMRFASLAAPTAADIEAFRVGQLGKKGGITSLMKSLGTLPGDERRAFGQRVNDLKQRIQDLVDRRAAEARERESRSALERERTDVTLPSRAPWLGSLHPVTQTWRDLERIFREMGYAVETGPEVEDDYHNFEALNLPKDHPARDATDTFYLEGGLVLRTHTSPVQIRTLESQPPPIRMICPGRAYRRDLDATHLPMFHQLEALVVDEGISMADLKGTTEALWKRLFGADVRVRLRPGYFPFVEPGFELDARCPFCTKGCSVCKQSTWIELLPCGMVHPNVLTAGGIDPEQWTGFAFGLGLSRLTMLRYGIDDVRLLLAGDLRFLEQFA
jgi:phenylalanyl-tRNA synthetase alpha chain